MRETSQIEVNLSAVERNVRRLTAMVGPKTSLCGVVKADAYGLGAVRIARALWRAGVSMFAVYTPEQAAEILRLNLGRPVLILMPVQDLARDECYRGLINGDLHLTVHGPEHASVLAGLSRQWGVDIPLHLEVDTGMHRGGCPTSEVGSVLATIDSARHLRLVGIFTHFASAEQDETYTRQQNTRFLEVVREVRQQEPTLVVHAANTCATMRDQRYHHDLVRVGQGWAGYGIEWFKEGEALPGASDLEPVVRWSSAIVEIKEVPDGESVGYGRRWRAQGPRRIALIPVGYADGYPAALAGDHGQSWQAQVLVRTGPDSWRPAPVVGAISMDQITVDITDLADTEEPVRAGTAVELITPDRAAPNHLTTLAELARTTPYELICRLHPQVRRVFVHEAASTTLASTTLARHAESRK